VIPISGLGRLTTLSVDPWPPNDLSVILGGAGEDAFVTTTLVPVIGVVAGFIGLRLYEGLLGRRGSGSGEQNVTSG
jgi:hypothetical protein